MRINSLTGLNSLALLNWVMPQLAEETPTHLYDGTGVVMAAGGKYLRYAYASLSILRELDPEIPIQIWLLKGETPDPRFDRLNVEWKECEPAFTWEGSLLRGGWSAKALAVKHSPFRHVLLLDADSAPVLTPDQLFDSKSYNSTGLVLFPDVCTHTQPQFWPSVGLRQNAVPEHESGQLLIDKVRHWETLKLTVWMNGHQWFHDLSHGDKNLWGVAATKLKIPFTQADAPKWQGWGIEHFLEGQSAFLHFMSWKRDGRHPELPEIIGKLVDDYDEISNLQTT